MRAHAIYTRACGRNVIRPFIFELKNIQTTVKIPTSSRKDKRNKKQPNNSVLVIFSWGMISKYIWAIGRGEGGGYMIRVRISFRYDVIPIPSRGFVKHDTCSKSRIGMSHSGASLPQLLYRNEFLILVDRHGLRLPGTWTILTQQVVAGKHNTFRNCVPKLVK